MDVLEAIATRRSVRKYLELPVEWDKVGRILEAGRLAPSAGNVQEWRFIVVTEPALRKQIAEAAMSQNWIERAPVHIVIFALVDKIKIHYGMRGERLYSIQDCAICATHMMLAAQEMGLSTCWVGAFDENKVQRVLKIPEECRPQVILTVGYADEKPHMPPRYPIDNLVFLERYGGPGKIKDMGSVLWDFNVVGRAEKDLKQGARDFERVTRKDRDRLFQRLRDTFGGMPKKREKTPPPKA